MIGWDGLGVVSFLLVIYYINRNSLSAGIITALSNRLGDVFFIIIIGVIRNSLRYSFVRVSLGNFIFWTGLVLLGSITKSAQIPFSAWLPEAIAAPTPVSTLVHSSTLVTAGVYVLVRFNDVLGIFSRSILLFFSILTIILAGIGAITEVDIKKVVALSTLRQVGIIIFSLGIGAVDIAVFHLVVHAFF